MILSFMRYQKYNHLIQIKEIKIIFNWGSGVCNHRFYKLKLEYQLVNSVYSNLLVLKFRYKFR